MLRHLFVAGRGDSPTDGLHFATRAEDGWVVRQRAVVDELAALCRHPSLPVVYGVSGLGRGRLHAWDVRDVAGRGVAELVDRDCSGDIPCDLAVDPSGTVLVSVNYGFESTGGSLCLWALDSSGAPGGEPRVVVLEGQVGVEDGRQDRPHPHQVVFRGKTLFVPDLGADRIRRFRLDAHALTLTEEAPLVAPAGSGPRHMAFAGESVIIASAELASGILMMSAEPGGSAVLVPSTAETGPVGGRHPRNYPGDLKLSPDGRWAYIANRGYETVATFDVSGERPELVDERPTGVAWPQHLLVSEHELLVAGWDSGVVVSLPLEGGIPGASRPLFDCPGAGWLLE